MRKELITAIALIFIGISVVLGGLLFKAQRQLSSGTDGQAGATKDLKLPAPRSYSQTIALPAPKLRGTMSVEQALNERRTQRTFKDQALTLAELSQMLWSAQGITSTSGKRTAPSAMEIYPFSVYVLVRNVAGLNSGLYEYLPAKQALGDMKLTDANTLFNNSGVEAGAKTSPVVVLLTAAMDKGYDKLKAGAVSSAYLEGGHIGENMYLEAQSLKLGMVVMGGTGTAAKALKLDPAETMVYVIPIGVPSPATSSAATK